MCLLRSYIRLNCISQDKILTAYFKAFGRYCDPLQWCPQVVTRAHRHVMSQKTGPPLWWRSRSSWSSCVVCCPIREANCAYHRLCSGLGCSFWNKLAPSLPSRTNVVQCPRPCHHLRAPIIAIKATHWIAGSSCYSWDRVFIVVDLFADQIVSASNIDKTLMNNHIEAKTTQLESILQYL